MSNKEETVSLLKEAKARMMDPNHIVKNWENIFEGKRGGKPRNKKAVCRVCMFGALELNYRKNNLQFDYNAYSDSQVSLAETLLAKAKDSLGIGHWFTTPFTYDEVHEIFDLAIELAENNKY